MDTCLSFGDLPLSYPLMDSNNVGILQRFCLKFENSTGSKNEQYKAKPALVLSAYIDKGKVTKVRAAFIIWNRIKKLIHDLIQLYDFG